MPAEPSSVAPPQSLDLSALGEALSDPAEPGQGAQDAEPYSFGDDNEDDGRPSVAHSNASAAEVKEEAGASGMESQATSKDLPSQSTAAAHTSDSSAAAPPPAPALPANSDVENLQNLFPDIEHDVIQAVLSSQSDLDSAVTTLLQMSDPTFSAPASTALSQSESDAALARSLAAEQDRLASRGGGPFMGALPAQQQPAYDPTRLTYAPRVRRVPPTSPSTSTQSRNSSQPQQQQQQQQQQQHDSMQSIFPKWPGPDEAKAWQDDINKFAENGMAKAASTFSALRARATAMASHSPSSSSPVSGGAQQRQSPSSASGSGAGSFLSSLGLGGPSTRANAGYDRDPSPVGEDELARILARGGRSPSGREDDHDGPSPPPKADRNSAAAFAGSRGRAVQDRYGALAGGGARRGSAQAARDRAQARSGAGAGRDDDDDDDLGWGAAARTGDSTPAKSAKYTPPGQSQAASTAKSQDSISRMDSAASRGISRGSAPTSPAIAGAATVGGASAAALTAPSQSDDEDDLEYVSNPFEEED